MAESLNGLYKTEVIYNTDHFGPWRTVEDVELATLVWSDWFNNRRLHSAIGNVPQAEFEARWHDQQHIATDANMATCETQPNDTLVGLVT